MCNRRTRRRRRALRDNTGMDIVLNGDMLTLGDAPTILDLLQTQGLAERRVAVEVNGEIVPRGRHATHALRDGDRVEIVHALGGG
jgi:sulfur carrier protein